MNKAIILDRDGTINIDKGYVNTIEQFVFIDGVIEAMKMFCEAGFKLIIVTNQSGIARGFYTEEAFLTLNQWMIEQLNHQGVSIAKVYYCPHLPDGTIPEYTRNCNCRKPGLELFYKAIEELEIDLNHSYAIGDKTRDLSICEVTPIKGILLSTSPEETKYQTTGTLLEAANLIINSI